MSYLAFTDPFEYLCYGSTTIIFFNPFSAGTVFRRKIRTSKDGPHTERVQHVSNQGFRGK